MVIDWKDKRRLVGTPSLEERPCGSCLLRQPKSCSHGRTPTKRLVVGGLVLALAAGSLLLVVVTVVVAVLRLARRALQTALEVAILTCPEHVVRVPVENDRRKDVTERELAVALAALARERSRR